MAVGAIFLIPPALEHLGANADQLAVWALAAIPTIVLADILLCINIALGRVAFANYCRVAGPILLLAGTVVLTLRHAVTPESIVALTIASGIVSLVVAAVGLPWRRIALSVRELLEDLRFGTKAHLGSIVGMANVRLDLVLMSVFVSASQVGYYGVANNLMAPVTSLGAAGAVLLTPHVAGLVHADHHHGGLDEAQLASTRNQGRMYFMLSVVGAAGLAALAPVVIPLLFGAAFEPVVLLVWVLIPGYVARSYTALISAGTLGMRRPWVGNMTEGAGFLVTLALLPLLLPRYGALGAAITSTAAYCISSLVALLAIRRLRRQIDRRINAEPVTGALSRPTTVVASRGG